MENVSRLQATLCMLNERASKQCMTCKDFATVKFMEAFVLEQQSAEKSVEDLIHMIKVMGNDDKNLYYINKNLKKMVGKAAESAGA